MGTDERDGKKMKCRICINGVVITYGIDEIGPRDTGHCEHCGALYWIEKGDWKCKPAN